MASDNSIIKRKVDELTGESNHEATVKMDLVSVKAASETTARIKKYPKKKKKRRVKKRSKMETLEAKWFEVKQAIQKDKSRNTNDLQVASDYIQELKTKVGRQSHLNHLKSKIASYQDLVEELLTKNSREEDKADSNTVTLPLQQWLNLKDRIEKLQNNNDDADVDEK